MTQSYNTNTTNPNFHNNWLSADSNSQVVEFQLYSNMTKMGTICNPESSLMISITELCGSQSFEAVNLSTATYCILQNTINDLNSNMNFQKQSEKEILQCTTYGVTDETLNHNKSTAHNHDVRHTELDRNNLTCECGIMRLTQNRVKM